MDCSTAVHFKAVQTRSTAFTHLLWFKSRSAQTAVVVSVRTPKRLWNNIWPISMPSKNRNPPPLVEQRERTQTLITHPTHSDTYHPPQPATALATQPQPSAHLLHPIPSCRPGRKKERERERQKECADKHPPQITMSATRSPLAINAFMSKNSSPRPASSAKWTENVDTPAPYPRCGPPSERASAPLSRKRRITTIRREVRAYRTLEMGPLVLCSCGLHLLNVGRRSAPVCSTTVVRSARFAHGVWSRTGAGVA